MRVLPQKMIPNTITILNKLSKADSATGQDVWYKKVLKNCSWNIAQNASQNGTVSDVGEIIQVQIPTKQLYKYLPYKQWKKAGMQDTAFTISMNDYIVLGEVTEDVTAQNIINVIKLYEPNTCKIRLFNDLSFDGVVGLSYLEQFASIYYVEGV